MFRCALYYIVLIATFPVFALQEKNVPVTWENFNSAETHIMFGNCIAMG
jgi:hypothetical protein